MVAEVGHVEYYTTLIFCYSEVQIESFEDEGTLGSDTILHRKVNTATELSETSHGSKNFQPNQCLDTPILLSILKIPAAS